MQRVETSTTTNPQAKAQLKQLLTDLSKELERAPQNKMAEAEAVAETAKQLIEQVTKDRPNRPLVQISAEGLRKAAQSFANALPAVLTIATKMILLPKH